MAEKDRPGQNPESHHSLVEKITETISAYKERDPLLEGLHIPLIAKDPHELGDTVTQLVGPNPEIKALPLYTKVVDKRTQVNFTQFLSTKIPGVWLMSHSIHSGISRSPHGNYVSRKTQTTYDLIGAGRVVDTMLRVKEQLVESLSKPQE